MNTSRASFTRRRFLRLSALAAPAGTVAVSHGGWFVAGSDRLRVGLVGCGRRGLGAAMNCVASSPGVEITALADRFPDRVEAALRRLKDNSQPTEWDASRPWREADKVKATPDTCFSGVNCVEQLMGSGVDLVILAAPPCFRPAHFEAAVRAGKHVFLERPVAVDAAGVQSIFVHSDLARRKGLGVVAGTQRRHDFAYREMMSRIHDGAIGDVLGMEVHQPDPILDTRDNPFDIACELGTRLRQWFLWISLGGGAVVREHVPSLDLLNWAMGAPPAEVLPARGKGWKSDISQWDGYLCYNIGFRYPTGTVTFLMAVHVHPPWGGRVIPPLRIIGTQGHALPGHIVGLHSWTYAGRRPNPYEQEHADLIASLRAGRPLNEGRQIAQATLTAIMARAVYCCPMRVSWDLALQGGDDPNALLALQLDRKVYSLDEESEHLLRTAELEPGAPPPAMYRYLAEYEPKGRADQPPSPPAGSL